MTDNNVKYKVVHMQSGGWCVVVATKSGEENRFFGFRDEAHARDWTIKKTLAESARRGQGAS
jgi:hypothetical protein